MKARNYACATDIFKNIARRAFRRPVTDEDIAGALAFFKTGRATYSNFESGIQYGLTAILASPKFLYRAEPTPRTAAPGTNYKISNLELASRLSFFLWSSIPDETLLDLAVKGRLSDPAVLEQQVRRMLADPRSKSLVTNFAFQWLRVRDLDKIDPDAILFPNFDNGLKTAFRKEMELFVGSVFKEDRNVMDLMNANYTFVNERLAAHYGIPDIRGAQFRKVTLSGSQPLGTPRQRQRSAGDLLSESDVYRSARRLHPGDDYRNAAGGTAARRRSVQGNKGRRKAQDGPRDHAGPPRESDLQLLPRNPGSAGFCDGKLRCCWRMANKGSLGRRSRSIRPAPWQTERPSKGPDDLRKALTKRPDQFVQTTDTKADDVRARPQRGVLRHADGSQDCPRLRKRQLQVFIDRAGYCEKSGVPVAART